MNLKATFYPLALILLLKMLTEVLINFDYLSRKHEKKFTENKSSVFETEYNVSLNATNYFV